MGLRSAYAEQEKVFKKIGLNYPVPNRYETVSPEVIRPYMEKGPQVMDELKDFPVATSSFASAVCEHVSTKVSDQWDNAKLTFEHAPDSFTKGQLSYWFVKMCGSSKKRLQDLVDFSSRQEPRDLRDLLGFLAPKVNQEQWDTLAPKMTVPDDQMMLRNLTTRKAKTMEKNGVTPWFPSVEPHNDTSHQE